MHKYWWYFSGSFCAVCTEIYGFVAERGAYTAPATAVRTAARRARDGALYSNLVIKHYCNEERREQRSLSGSQGHTICSGAKLKYTTRSRVVQVAQISGRVENHKI
jgi:hypothetical protein